MDTDPSVAGRLAARLPDDRRGRCLVAGLWFGVPGAAVGLVIVAGWSLTTSWSDVLALDPVAVALPVGMALAAGLAAAIVAAPLWFFLVEHPDEPTLLRGALVGAAVGVLAHPLMWALAGLGTGVVFLVLEGPSVAAGTDLAAIGGILGVFALFTVVGVLLTGVVTVPIAVGAGLSLASVRGAVVETPRADRSQQDL